MSWNTSFEHRDNRRRMAELVDEPGWGTVHPAHELSRGAEPGFAAPLPFAEPELPLVSSLSRLLQGPFVMDGDLCDVTPGAEAIVLVSPRGEKILMQNEGRVTFHVPAGWRILVGSKPLRSEGTVKRFVRVGDAVEEVEGRQSMLCLDNIPELYREADPFGPRR